jgi:2-C-methyl-D-erythritol 4-phosphate cytidylyltransferase
MHTNRKQTTTKYWAVIPAAGAGRRMGSDQPKQYLELLGKTVLEHTIERLANTPEIQGVVVTLSPDDGYWSELGITCDKPLFKVEGGAERCHSVLNALDFLNGVADHNDWVLVHDAARPCLRQDDIERLINELNSHPVGGLMGLPVSDTVKRTDAAGDVLQTVERNHLWRALTPQMFRLGELREALRGAIDNSQLVTDEASAIELTGKAPHMVEGHADNIKITRPQDLKLAELYLTQQENESCA